jgi:hypothetical protein
MRYAVTWWTNMSDNDTAVTVTGIPTFAGCLALLPHGPKNWERYSIDKGKRQIERGDPHGPRGMPAKERDKIGAFAPRVIFHP